MRRNLDFYKPQAQRTNFWAPQQGGRELRSTRKGHAESAALLTPRVADGCATPAKSLQSTLFLPKTSQLCVIARPQRGRGNLKVKGMASRNEAREWETRQKPYHKKHGYTASFCFLSLYLWFCFVTRNHSSFRDDKSIRLRLPRRAQKLRPPRNDKIDRLDRKHGTQNSIFGIRKNVSYLLPDFDGSGLF